jgi:hypothetical protein
LHTLWIRRKFQRRTRVSCALSTAEPLFKTKPETVSLQNPPGAEKIGCHRGCTFSEIGVSDLQVPEMQNAARQKRGCCLQRRNSRLPERIPLWVLQVEVKTHQYSPAQKGSMPEMRETHFSERAAQYIFPSLKIDGQTFCQVGKQAVQRKHDGEDFEMLPAFFRLLFDFCINASKKIMRLRRNYPVAVGCQLL